MIGGLIQSLQIAIVECDTAYGGTRSNTAMHCQAAKDHDYTVTVDIGVMDEGGSMTFPVTGGTDLTESYVGEHFPDHDYCVIPSHFKGHAIARSGGAIKNISVGLVSVEGKDRIHTAGKGGNM